MASLCVLVIISSRVLCHVVDVAGWRAGATAQTRSRLQRVPTELARPQLSLTGACSSLFNVRTPLPIHLTFRLSIFQSVTSHTTATRPAPHRVCLSHELFLCHSNKTRLESRGSACMASRLHTEALEQIVREQLAFVFELGQFHLLLSAVWSRCGNQTTCCHAAVLSVFAVAGICRDFAHLSATLTVSAFSSVSDPLITMQTTY